MRLSLATAISKALWKFQSLNNFADRTRALQALDKELYKPELLMACPKCQRVGTPILAPSFFSEAHFAAKCWFCGGELNSIRRDAGYEYVYKEQQDGLYADRPTGNESSGEGSTRPSTAERVDSERQLGGDETVRPSNELGSASDAPATDRQGPELLDALERYEPSFITNFRIIQSAVHKTAVDHGWWEGEAGRDPLTLQMLIVTEIAEAAEAARKGNPPDEHVPEFSSEEVEYADAIIRIMDLAEKRGLRIAEALIAKARFNESRPYRHGGKLA